jgi:hypothetical protein
MKLEIGKSYRHREGFFIRTIDGIDGDQVKWHDHAGAHVCSKKTFSKVCIAPANQKDMEQYEQTVAALRKARERELEYARISEIDKAFLANCKDAKKRGLTYVVINSPQELGDTYDQVMQNLAMLEKDCLYLRIIRKT